MYEKTHQEAEQQYRNHVKEGKSKILVWKSLCGEFVSIMDPEVLTLTGTVEGCGGQQVVFICSEVLTLTRTLVGSGGQQVVFISSTLSGC